MMRLLTRYPECVANCIAIAPGGISRHMPRLFHRMKNSVLAVFSRNLFSAGDVRHMLDECVFDKTAITERDVKQYYAPISDGLSREALMYAVTNFDMKGTADALRSLDHEILCVWGREDRWHPPSGSVYFQGILQNGRYYMIRNTGHLVQEENPAKLLRSCSRTSRRRCRAIRRTRTRTIRAGTHDRSVALGDTAVTEKAARLRGKPVDDHPHRRRRQDPLPAVRADRDAGPGGFCAQLQARRAGRAGGATLSARHFFCGTERNRRHGDHGGGLHQGTAAAAEPHGGKTTGKTARRPLLAAAGLSHFPCAAGRARVRRARVRGGAGARGRRLHVPHAATRASTCSSKR